MQRTFPAVVWDTTFQTWAVAVRTRRARHTVTLATCSWGGSIRVKRTRSRPCPPREVTAGNTVAVMTSRTQMEDWISCTHRIKNFKRKVINLLQHNGCSWGIHFKRGHFGLRNMWLKFHEPTGSNYYTVLLCRTENRLCEIPKPVFRWYRTFTLCRLLTLDYPRTDPSANRNVCTS